MLAILLLFTVLVTGLILTTFLRIQYVRAKERRMIKLANVSPRGFRLFGVESWDWKDFLRLWTPDSYTPEAHVIHAIYQGIARHTKQAELVEAEKQDWYERGRDFDPSWFSDPIPQEIIARWQNVSRNTLREAEEEMCWWGISPPQHYHLFLADEVEFTIAPQKIGGPKENRPISLQALGFMRKIRKGDIFEIEVNMGTWATVRDSSGNTNGYFYHTCNSTCYLGPGLLKVTGISADLGLVRFDYEKPSWRLAARSCCGSGSDLELTFESFMKLVGDSSHKDYRSATNAG